ARQTKPPGDLAAHRIESRFGSYAAIRIKKLVGNAELAKHSDIIGCVSHLLRRPEELQGAMRAFVVGNTGGLTEVAQTIAAVFGQRNHARLVKGIAPRCAVSQQA